MRGLWFFVIMLIADSVASAAAVTTYAPTRDTFMRGGPTDLHGTDTNGRASKAYIDFYITDFDRVAINTFLESDHLTPRHRPTPGPLPARRGEKQIPSSNPARRRQHPRPRWRLKRRQIPHSPQHESGQSKIRRREKERQNDRLIVNRGKKGSSSAFLSLFLRASALKHGAPTAKNRLSVHALRLERFKKQCSHTFTAGIEDADGSLRLRHQQHGTKNAAERKVGDLRVIDTQSDDVFAGVQSGGHVHLEG